MSFSEWLTIGSITSYLVSGSLYYRYKGRFNYSLAMGSLLFVMLIIMYTVITH